MKLESLPLAPANWTPQSRKNAAKIANAMLEVVLQELRAKADAPPPHVDTNIKRAFAVAADEFERLRVEP